MNEHQTADRQHWQPLHYVSLDGETFPRSYYSIKHHGQIRDAITFTTSFLRRLSQLPA